MSWRQALAELIAGNELDVLMRGVRGLNDKLVSVINARNGILSGYLDATKLYGEAVAIGGAPYISMGISNVPNPSVLPSLQALGTAVKGVKFFARDVFLLTMLDRVFAEVASELGKMDLRNDANAVESTLNQIRRFVMETDDKFGFRVVPEYMETKSAILQNAKAEWAHRGVATNAFGDPRWLEGVVAAADQVVPVPQPSGGSSSSMFTTPMGPSLMHGMGAVTVLVAILLKVLGIVAVTVVAIVAIRRLIPDQNAKAEHAADLLRDYQQQKSREALQMRAQGKSEAEISKRMADIDAEAKRAVDAIPDAPAPLGGLFKWLGIAAGVGVGTKIAGVW